MAKDGMKNVHFKVTEEEYLLLREGAYHMSVHELPDRPFTCSSYAKYLVLGFLGDIRERKEEIAAEKEAKEEQSHLKEVQMMN